MIAPVMCLKSCSPRRQLRKQLSQLGYYSDHDSAKPPVSRGGAPPPAAAPSLSPAAAPSLSPAALGTPNGRGSSADSGVRVSSDRESVVAGGGGGTGTGGTSGNLSDSTTSGEGTTGYCVTGCGACQMSSNLSYVCSYPFCLCSVEGCALGRVGSNGFGTRAGFLGIAMNRMALKLFA